MEDDRIISGKSEGFEEVNSELSLRPQYLNQYIGQEKLKNEIAVYIKALKKEKKPSTMCFYMDRQVWGRQPCH